MRPRFRFTLSNATLGDQIISEPEGWADIKTNLERDPNYHSLIENFEIPLTFYGSGGTIDGGYNYIKSALALGIDELVTLLIEIKFDYDDGYAVLFNGTIDLSTKKEVDFRKIQCAIIRDSLWAKFINRKETKVDLLSSNDQEGNVISALSPRTINLPSQTIRALYHAEMTSYSSDKRDDIIYYFTNVFNPFANLPLLYGTIELPEITSDEIEDRYTYFSEVTDSPYENIRFKYKTKAIIDMQIVLSTVPYSAAIMAGDKIDSAVSLKLYKNWREENTVSELLGIATKTDLGVNGASGRSVFSFQGTIEFKAGETLTWIFANSHTSQDLNIQNAYIIYNDFYENSYIDIKAGTIDVDTEGQAVQIGEAVDSILRQITCSETILTSPYLLNPSSCGYEFILLMGLHARGWTMVEKKMAISFQQWWEGANPIMNLGLGYEELGSPAESSIYIGQKGDFYDATESIQLYGVNNIEIEFDQEFLTKNIEVGFQKWDVEANSGNDDPQTRKRYRTRYKSFGKDLQLLSSFYAASAGIEETRRNRKQTGKDYRLDEEVFIIATTSEASEIELFLNSPETITGLNDAETRYNVRLTPARMIQSWLNILSGQLYENYPLEKFYYSTGEGNTEMEWGGDGLCANGTLKENQDIDLLPEYLFQPQIYKFTHPLTWEEYLNIRSNRKRAIGVNYYDHNGLQQHITLYIKKLSWFINRSVMEFEGWLSNPVGVTPPPSPTLVPITLQAQSTENLDSGSPVYNVTFGTDSPSANFTLNGTDSESQSSNILEGEGLVASISRTGVSEGSIIINWLKNGVVVFTKQISSNQDINQSYKFTNILSGDVLKVTIVETAYITLTSTSEGMNAPWTVVFKLYDSSSSLLGTINQIVTIGFGQTVENLLTTQSVDNMTVQVIRTNDGSDSNVNDYTSVRWLKNDVELRSDFVMIDSPFNVIYSIPGIVQGDKVSVLISEG